MKVFKDWKSAHSYAVETARACGMSTGIEKTKEFNRTLFAVRLLPRPENRTGSELRMEIVNPNDPI
jgi:hypothetical protein